MDRRITIRITTPPDAEFDPVAGEYADGEPTVADHDVWAERRDVDAETRRVEVGTFDFVSARRDYKVRWFRELATAPFKHVNVIEGAECLSVVNVISPGDQRRRFLVVQARTLQQ